MAGMHVERVRLPEDAAIAPAKLTRYLLVRQARSDKSEFLGKGGYTLDTARILLEDLRKLLTQPAAPLAQGPFGQFYEIRAPLQSPAGAALYVRTIWMTEHLSGLTKFITLIPDKEFDP